MKEAIMEDEIEQFRRAVKAWRGHRKLGARPYTSGMKTKAVQLAEGLAVRGIPASRIPPMLGIAMGTLKKWRGPRRKSALIPVRLVPEAVSATRAAPLISVRMVSPRGYRIETADAATAVALLRALG